MSDPKYIYGEIDANEWHLYELRDDHPTQPGYHLIATIECEEEVIERITDALNGRACTWTQDEDDAGELEQDTESTHDGPSGKAKDDLPRRPDAIEQVESADGSSDGTNVGQLASPNGEGAG